MATAGVMNPLNNGWTGGFVEPNVSRHKESFDAKKHLAFKPPSKIYTMADLALPENTGVSPVAVSEPFPLFTEDAVMRMRQEVLSKEVMANCKYSSNLSQAQLRGFANKYVKLCVMHKTTIFQSVY